MSGPMKSGLIFGLIGIAAVVGLPFIPFLGILVCGPVAAIIGAVAGYFGVRWGSPSAGVGSGVLAGTIAGVGTLIGSVIFFLIAIRIASSMPGFEQQVQEMLRRQQPNSQLTPQDITNILTGFGPFIGFCAGLINLVIALALGALGGWLATRNRPQIAQVPPVEPPTSTPYA